MATLSIERSTLSPLEAAYSAVAAIHLGEPCILLLAKLRGLGGHARLAFVNRTLDGAAYAPLPESFEEREVERELDCGYRLVGVSVLRPDGSVEWLDAQLRPVPGEPRELRGREEP